MFQEQNISCLMFICPLHGEHVNHNMLQLSLHGGGKIATILSCSRLTAKLQISPLIVINIPNGRLRHFSGIFFPLENGSNFPCFQWNLENNNLILRGKWVEYEWGMVDPCVTLLTFPKPKYFSWIFPDFSWFSMIFWYLSKMLSKNSLIWNAYTLPPVTWPRK